uniref:Uncharacterized protein n=1 Tax=Sphaerodactylus townsendi TaxID=933632 RepID=A0ACB8F0Z3_9SAUR
MSSEPQPVGEVAATDQGCPIPVDLKGTLDSASDQAEGPRILLGTVADGEAPTPGGFLGSINQFMTAPLDGLQGVTLRRHRAARRKGPIHRKQKPGSCFNCRRRPGIWRERSIAGSCARGNGISSTCKRPSPRLAKWPLLLEMEWLGHQLPRRQHLLSQLSRLWFQPPLLFQYLFSSPSRLRFQPQLLYRLQSSLFNQDPLQRQYRLNQFQYQASRLSSRALEGSPCRLLHLLHYRFCL